MISTPLSQRAIALCVNVEDMSVGVDASSLRSLADVLRTLTGAVEQRAHASDFRESKNEGQAEEYDRVARAGLTFAADKAREL